jgi:hypothetical protein
MFGAKIGIALREKFVELEMVPYNREIFSAWLFVWLGSRIPCPRCGK